MPLTWLADANAAAGSSFDDFGRNTDGRITWSNANAWVADLSISGIDGWCPPTTLQHDMTCQNQSSSGTGCPGSEMGNNVLGGIAKIELLLLRIPIRQSSRLTPWFVFFQETLA